MHFVEYWSLEYLEVQKSLIQCLTVLQKYLYNLSGHIFRPVWFFQISMTFSETLCQIISDGTAK